MFSIGRKTDLLSGGNGLEIFGDKVIKHNLDICVVFDGVFTVHLGSVLFSKVRISDCLVNWFFFFSTCQSFFLDVNDVNE